MTEPEWLACEDPREMLEHLDLRASHRKLRLFSAACCRRVWRLLDDPRCRASVEAAEAYAEGAAKEKALTEAHKGSERAYYDALNLLQGENPEDYGECETPAAARTSAAEAACVCSMADLKVVVEAYRLAAAAVGGGWRSPRDPNELAVLAERLRDIVGDIFHPATFDPRWRTADVASLALAAYEGRKLPSGEMERARLCILADALEDAGCGEEGLLRHLRSKLGHVWGCWAVDLVLGKG